MLNIILSIVFALSGAVLVLLSIIILRENYRGRVNRVTAMMLFFAGIAPVLATVYYAIVLPSGRELPLWVYNLSYIWELFFPSLLLFSAIFPVENSFFKRRPRLFYAAFIPHIVHIIIVVFFADPDKFFSTLKMTSDAPIIGVLLEYLSYVFIPFAVLFSLALEFHVRFFSLVNLFYVIVALVLLYQGAKSVINPRIKKQVKLISYGIRISVGLYAVAYIIPQVFDYDLNVQIRYSLIIIGLLGGPGFIAWAIMKHRFLDIRLIVRQSLVYSLASAIVIGFYLVFINRFGRFLNSVLGETAAILEVAVILIALLFFQPLLNLIDKLLRKGLIKGSADFRVVLENFSRRIITLLEFDKLIKEILRTFKEDMLIENTLVCIPGSKGQCAVYSPFELRPAPHKKDRVLESFLIVREAPVTADDLPTPALSAETRALFKDNETEIIIPLISSHRLMGYIALGKKASGMAYNTEDLSMFRVLANQIVVAISNARLYIESLERQRYEEELALARNIQQQLLPDIIPSNERLQFTAFSEPSREVGGDYYDFITSTAGNQLVFCIGDASGKGVPASLLVARMQAILHSISQADIGIQDKIAHVNNVLFRSGMPESFITFFYGELNQDNMLFKYCNAGHNYPILLRENGECEYLKDGGLILGAFGGATYISGEVGLYPGDLLICFTDGITEAMNPSDEEFGDKRLEDLILRNRNLPLPQLQTKILDNVKEHCSGRPFEDDCTLLLMKVLPLS
ncbi:MAG: SpoIIE family protein phosphatase [candidate division Zixibacteria bacterium]|nr:SpoIIE family protein phosphatase [candidate division Zixibacteria bacterium]